MDSSEETTRRSERLMATAVEEAQTLLGKRDPNALLAVALSNALAALTVEIRGLRLAQEAAAGVLARSTGGRNGGGGYDGYGRDPDGRAWRGSLRTRHDRKEKDHGF